MSSSPRIKSDGKPRYALYTRISKDPDGTSTAPARQEKECRALAKERGFHIVDVYTDADLTAWKEGVRRPQYEEMLVAMADGAYDGVIVWKLDRLVRRTVEFWRWWKVAEEHGVDLVSKNDAFIDTTTPIGRGIVGLIVSLAEQESYNTSLRLKAKEREMAESGRHKFAGRRAYGVRPPTAEEIAVGASPRDWTIEPDEVAVIGDVAGRLLAGESVPSIVRDLNERGVPSATGKRWSRRAVTSLMMQARLFGWREHNGELVAKGDWPVILDEATGRKLREILPAREGSGAVPARRRHLLSGLLRCGKCGEPLKAGSAIAGGLPRYTCRPKVDGGCNGTTIERPPVDAVVAEMALLRLESPNVASMLRARDTKRRTGDDAAILADLAEVTEKIEQAAIEYANDDMTVVAYKAAISALERRSATLTARLAEIREAEPLAKLGDLSGGLRRAWASMSDDRRRAVLDVLLEKIVVHGSDSDWYRERLAETLLIQAKHARAVGDQRLAKRRRRQAVERVGEDTVATMEKAIEKDPGAVDDCTSSRSFRPERLEPIWRV